MSHLIRTEQQCGHCLSACLNPFQISLLYGHINNSVKARHHKTNSRMVQLIFRISQIRRTFIRLIFLSRFMVTNKQLKIPKTQSNKQNAHQEFVKQLCNMMLPFYKAEINKILVSHIHIPLPFLFQWIYK